MLRELNRWLLVCKEKRVAKPDDRTITKNIIVPKYFDDELVVEAIKNDMAFEASLGSSFAMTFDAIDTDDQFHTNATNPDFNYLYYQYRVSTQ